jgi:UDP-N-acetylmuramate--alanine ligase
VTAAKAKQIPVIPRAEMLAELMRLKFGVAIAGAHGKTTTTSMVANVLAQGGLDPTMVIGGKVNALGSHARLGRGELLVAEADESDGSFLRLSPTIIAVTNLDREHLDHYGSMERIYESFLEFINKVPFYGLAVLCADDHRLRGLFPNIVKRYYTYGLSESDGATPDFRATDIVAKQGGSEFRAFFRTRNLGPFRLAVPGIHNVSNALAAIAIGVELDVPVDLIRKALAAFTGVERRFHIRGESNGVMVVDDYGHHPTEIKATLAAAKQGWPERRLVVLFQPHRYTRTRDLLEDFSKAFQDADRLFLTEIYAASESPIPGVSGARLAEAIRAVGHPPVTFVERKDQLTDQVLPQLKPGDLVITLGAGDIWKTGPALLEKLAAAS